MGLLFWRKKKQQQQPSSAAGGGDATSAAELEAERMTNGAVKVRRPAHLTVFEFGSAAASRDRVTLAGYCPVSDKLEPCRWELIPAAGAQPAEFRVLF